MVAQGSREGVGVYSGTGITCYRDPGKGRGSMVAQGSHAMDPGRGWGSMGSREGEGVYGGTGSHARDPGRGSMETWLLYRDCMEGGGGLYGITRGREDMWWYRDCTLGERIL